MRPNPAEILDYAPGDLYEQQIDALAAFHTCDRGLILRGRMGSGKTVVAEMLARCTGAKEFHSPLRLSSLAGFFIAAEELAAWWTERPFRFEDGSTIARRDHMIDLIQATRIKSLIVVDDLGVENDRHGEEIVSAMNYLLDRWAHREAGRLVLTTNATDEQLEDAYGARLGDRLKDRFSVVTFDSDAAHFRGKSAAKPKRVKKLRERAETLLGWIIDDLLDPSAGAGAVAQHFQPRKLLDRKAKRIERCKKQLRALKKSG